MTSLPSAFEHAQAHGLGVLVAELEDVADLDGLVRLRAARRSVDAGVARGHLAQVVELGLEVLAGRDVAQVVVVLVGAGDHVPAARAAPGRRGSCMFVDADRTERAGVGAEPLANLLGMRGAELGARRRRPELRLAQADDRRAAAPGRACRRRPSPGSSSARSRAGR